VAALFEFRSCHAAAPLVKDAAHRRNLRSPRCTQAAGVDLINCVVLSRAETLLSLRIDGK